MVFLESKKMPRIYNIAKYQAEKRGVPFLLTKEEFNILNSTDCCHYCGISLKQYKKLLRRLFACQPGNARVDAIRWLPYMEGPGFKSLVVNFTFDRKDSFAGYTNENTVLSCWICNKLKGRYFSGILFKRIAKEMMAEIWRVVKEEYDFQYKS